MNYIDELAHRIKAKVPSGLLPEGDTTQLFRSYALLALAKGVQVTASDVHDAWAAWMSAIDPNHEAIRPFRDLGKEARREDQPFVDAIRASAHDA
jgi:hypothetical protein